MDPKAMYKLSYGLYVLSSEQGGRDAGCIINTAMQLTSSPNRISVTVNKQNHTHDVLRLRGEFNVSALTVDTPFELIERFGFRSGRDTDKFEGFSAFERAENGLTYITRYANSYISGRIINSVDLGTHTMFIADVTDCRLTGQADSLTYAYYQDNIKPKPQPAKKGAYRCTVCGYIYEGDELPADFICPICKHGADAFEKIS